MLSGVRGLHFTHRFIEGEVTKITECTIVCNRRTLRSQGLGLLCPAPILAHSFLRKEVGLYRRRQMRFLGLRAGLNEALWRLPTLLEGAADVYHERTDGVENTR